MCLTPNQDPLVLSRLGAAGLLSLALEELLLEAATTSRRSFISQQRNSLTVARILIQHLS